MTTDTTAELKDLARRWHECRGYDRSFRKDVTQLIYEMENRAPIERRICKLVGVKDAEFKGLIDGTLFLICRDVERIIRIEADGTFKQQE